MFALQRSLSFGYLRQHRTRTILVLFSIGLGVATLVATQALKATLHDTGRQAANPLSQIADLLILNAQTGVPRSLVDQVLHAGMPEVQDAEPLIFGRVAVKEADGSQRSVGLIGVDLSLHKLKLQRRTEDRSNPWGAELHIDPAAALLFAITPKGPWALLGGKLVDEIGDQKKTFVVRSPDGERELGRFGTIQFPSGSGMDRGGFLVVDLDLAAKLAPQGAPDRVGQINIHLTPEAATDPAAVERIRQQLQEVIGDQGDVRTLEANFETAREVTAGLELGFSIGGVAALVVGLFLVYNILSVSVAERRRDIGIMRAVGATRSQIAWLFLGEAACLGLVGSALGIPLGWALAHIALGPLESVLSDLVAPTEPIPIRISMSLMLLAIGSGTVTAILAALVPAGQAASEEPASAVRQAPRTPRLRHLLLHLAIIAVLLGAGAAATLLRESLPVHFGVFSGAILLFIGQLVAVPLLVRLLGRVLLPAFRPLLGVTGRLAADNVVRTPTRTGIVIAVLAATGSLMLLVAGFVDSTERGLRDWINRFVAADLFVTCGGSLHSASAVQPMKETVPAMLRAELPEVVAALGIRFHLLEFRSRIVFMLAVDANAFAEIPDTPYARNLLRYPRLQDPATALVSENFATLHHLNVGDHFQVRGPQGPVDLEIIGTVLDYAWNRGTITVNRNWYKDVFKDSLIDLCDLYLRPGSDPDAVRSKLEARFSKSEALFASTRAEIHQDITANLNRVYNLSYAQQGVVGIVALLGVASALFISVLHRRRELGLLRAVGASRGQVLWSVAAEALLMGLLGGLIGLAIGMDLEWYVVGVMVWDDAGFTFPMVVPWLAAVVVFVLSAVLATLVGLWPASVATRLRIPEAIAYE
jgi:putative ABC transport system permease protein